MNSKKRLVVGVSGASGAVLAVRLLETLASIDSVESHLIISQAAEITIRHETKRSIQQVQSLADEVYLADDVGASIASGSFHTDGMVIIPCSMKTLSAVANCYAADLITRAADVHLKEGRPLLLVTRETPLHLGHLRLMVQAAEIGAIIFPPVPAFYAVPLSIDHVVNNIIGRVLARLGIANDMFVTWQGD
jgi:4-hydroxy-3-polyprenylbenzoate decarboxylase